VGARRWKVVTLACAALLTGAVSTASAAPHVVAPRAQRPPPTLGVSVGTAAPEQSLPATITLAGTATASSALHALVRPAGTSGCARSFSTDRNANRTGSIVLADGVTEAAGAYSTTVSWTPEATGSYLVCAWLSGGGGVGPVSAPIAVRGPQVPVLTVGFSSTPTAGAAFDIDYTVQTDQPLRLLSTIRPAGTSPTCAASQPADTAANPGERVIFSGGVPVSGGPGTTSVSVKYPAGAYLICAWVTGPGRDETDATLATPFTVEAKPIVLRPLPSEVRITGIDARAGSGISVRGTSADGLSGSVTLTASCAGSSSRGTATAAHGRFTGRLALPRLCIAHDPVSVVAAWAGSTQYGSGEAIGKAVVDPARGHSASKPLLFSRIVKVGRRHRDVFRVRPREITVGAVRLDVRWKRWTAHGALATGTADPVRGHYRVSVHAFHPVRGRFACLIVTRSTAAGRRAHRYGLGRLGNSTFAWLQVRWLHRRASGATPWPRPGCPV
jgi:hypothetical protein